MNLKTLTYDSLIVVLAVAAVSDVVHVVAGFLAQKAGGLSASHMKCLFTS
jgi:hypothetical protein